MSTSLRGEQLGDAVGDVEAQLVHVRDGGEVEARGGDAVLGQLALEHEQRRERLLRPVLAGWPGAEVDPAHRHLLAVLGEAVEQFGVGGRH
ncbi:hypothetical protein [Nonomuraea salmonea]|uniref:hypothetical protein n=1 Tax=Nonomuraea salmonea TaxID=46181 RepID=UPI002FE9B424